MYSLKRLNVDNKSRSNPFSWRGQFTPELIDYFLGVHAESETLVGDPFSGSGTVLLECARRGLDAIGCEVNPAAYAMSKFFEIGTLPYAEKCGLCENIRWQIPLSHAEHNQPVYQKGIPANYRLAYDNLTQFAKRALEINLGSHELIVLLNILFKMERCKTLSVVDAWEKSYNEVSAFLLSLPESQSNISAILCDARSIYEHGDRKIDLIVTSPPYINVFNYHQNHRIIMELLDFDILAVAHSEFASNRKNRGNRFLTVIQYCLDMAQALNSMQKAMSENGTAIMIIGRESNVKKTAFYNGKIISDLCQETGICDIVHSSERHFQNKFGATIYEDILVLKPNVSEDSTDHIARSVALAHLNEAITRAPEESQEDLRKAISSVHKVKGSPVYKYRSKG